MKYMLLALLTMASVANASTKCTLTSGDGDTSPIRSLKSATLTTDQNSAEFDFNGKTVTASLMEKNRIIISAGEVMSQGYGYLFYADFSQGLTLECK